MIQGRKQETDIDTQHETTKVHTYLYEFDPKVATFQDTDMAKETTPEIVS